MIYLCFYFVILIILFLSVRFLYYIELIKLEEDEDDFEIIEIKQSFRKLIPIIIFWPFALALSIVVLIIWGIVQVLRSFFIKIDNVGKLFVKYIILKFKKKEE